MVGGKGRIRIVADVPSASGWVGAQRSTSGSYMKTSRPETALIIYYKPLRTVHSPITLPNANNKWLAVTWPNLESSEWPNEKKHAANLVKAGMIEGSVWSTHEEDAGSTQHMIWHVTRDGELRVNFVSNTGSSHSLQAFVGVGTQNIRFTRQTSEEYWLDKNPEYCRAWLLFEPVSGEAARPQYTRNSQSSDRHSYTRQPSNQGYSNQQSYYNQPPPPRTHQPSFDQQHFPQQPQFNPLPRPPIDLQTVPQPAVNQQPYIHQPLPRQPIQLATQPPPTRRKSTKRQTTKHHQQDSSTSILGPGHQVFESPRQMTMPLM